MRPKRPVESILALVRPTQRDIGFALFITLLAAVLRLSVAWHFAGEPVWDGHYYHFGAVRLADGFGYSEDVFRQGAYRWKPWAHYPVGYSFWLSIWYRVLGSHLWVAPLANAVVGTLTVFLVQRVTLSWLGPWRARLAATLLALHPGLVLYTAVVMSEPLAALLLLASVWVLDVFPWCGSPRGSAREVPRRECEVPRSECEVPRRLPWGWILAGILLGASVLVRPSSLVALPLYWFVLPGEWRRRGLGLAVLTALCFATILPWTLRNCRRMDGCALVSTNTGWNLAIGALTETGRFRPLRAADGCPVVTGQVQQDRCWMSRGLAEIRRAPWRWLRLAPDKLAQTFDHESFAVEYLREANPRAWPEQRRVAWRTCLTDAHRWLTALAAFSVVSFQWRRWRSGNIGVGTVVQLLLALGLAGLTYVVSQHDEHPFYWLILALVALWALPWPGAPNRSGLVGFSVGFVALTALTHVFFFGDDRYHLVISPLLCILGAALLRSPITARTQHRDRVNSDPASVPNSVPRSS